MSAKTNFKVGQHIRMASGIGEICSTRSTRYGGTYNVSPVDQHDLYAGYLPHIAQEWMLHELTEADLCRTALCGCGLIHVRPDYEIAKGR